MFYIIGGILTQVIDSDSTTIAVAYDRDGSVIDTLFAKISHP